MSVRRSSGRKRGRTFKKNGISRSVSRPKTVVGLQTKLLEDDPDGYEKFMRNPRMRAIIRSPAYHQWYHSRRPFDTPSDGGFKRLTLPNTVRAFEIDSQLPAPSEETISAWEKGQVNRVDMIGAFKFKGKGEYLHENPSKGTVRLTTLSGYGIDLNPTLEIVNSKPFREEFDMRDKDVVYADFDDYRDSLNSKNRKKLDENFKKLNDEEFVEYFEDEHDGVHFIDNLLQDDDVKNFFDLSKDLKVANSSAFKQKFGFEGFTIHATLDEYIDSLPEKKQKEIIKQYNDLSEAKFGDWISDYADDHDVAFLDALYDEDDVESFIDIKKSKSDGLKTAGRRNADGKYPRGSFAYDIANANAKKLKTMKSQLYLDEFETYELKRMRQAIAGTDKADDKTTKTVEVGGLLQHRKEKTEGQKIKPDTKDLRGLLSVVDKEIFNRTIYNKTTNKWKTITDNLGQKAEYKRQVFYKIDEDGMSEKQMKHLRLHRVTAEQLKAYIDARDESWDEAQPRTTLSIIKGYKKQSGSGRVASGQFHEVNVKHFKTLRPRKAKKSKPSKVKPVKKKKEDKIIEVKVPKNLDKLIES